MWDNVGGVGSASFFRDILVVSQTQEVHHHLEKLLVALHQHCRGDATVGGDRPWLVRVDARPQQLRLEALIEKVISVQIENQPLEDALSQLAREHGFNVIIGRAEIKDARHPLPLPLESLTASEISLGAALRRLLAPQRLDYVVRENVLYVTTEQAAQHRSETCMYRISDFVPSRWPSAAEFEQGLHAAAAGSPETKTSLESASAATMGPSR
jgi:hypothetical protein